MDSTGAEASNPGCRFSCLELLVLLFVYSVVEYYVREVSMRVLVPRALTRP